MGLFKIARYIHFVLLEAIHIALLNQLTYRYLKEEEPIHYCCGEIPDKFDRGSWSPILFSPLHPKGVLSAEITSIVQYIHQYNRGHTSGKRWTSAENALHICQ